MAKRISQRFVRKEPRPTSATSYVPTSDEIAQRTLGFNILDGPREDAYKPANGIKLFTLSESSNEDLLPEERDNYVPRNVDTQSFDEQEDSDGPLMSTRELPRSLRNTVNEIVADISPKYKPGM